MRASDVSTCCVFSFYDVQDNPYVEQAARGRKDLVPFAFLNPKHATAAATLDHLVTAQGFRGLKLHPFADGFHLNNFKIVDPLFEVCEHHGIPILCHGLADNVYNTVYAFAEMADRFPRVNLIMAHGGFMWSRAEAVRASKTRPNLFIETTCLLPAGYRRRHRRHRGGEVHLRKRRALGRFRRRDPQDQEGRPEGQRPRADPRREPRAATGSQGPGRDSVADRSRAMWRRFLRLALIVGALTVLAPYHGGRPDRAARRGGGRGSRDARPADERLAAHLEHRPEHFDSLLVRDLKTFAYRPGLAESYRLLNDTTWQFKLRRGVRFHNGEEFNAEAVKFSIERILNPEQKSPSREA